MNTYIKGENAVGHTAYFPLATIYLTITTFGLLMYIMEN